MSWLHNAEESSDSAQTEHKESLSFDITTLLDDFCPFGARVGEFKRRNSKNAKRRRADGKQGDGSYEEYDFSDMFEFV